MWRRKARKGKGENQNQADKEAGVDSTGDTFLGHYFSEHWTVLGESAR